MLARACLFMNIETFRLSFSQVFHLTIFTESLYFRYADMYQGHIILLRIQFTLHLMSFILNVVPIRLIVFVEGIPTKMFDRNTKYEFIRLNWHYLLGTRNPNYYILWIYTSFVRPTLLYASFLWNHLLASKNLTNSKEWQHQP